MFIMVTLRLLILLKWAIQSLGLVIGISWLFFGKLKLTFNPINQDTFLLIMCYFFLLIVPEILFFSLLWIIKGAYKFKQSQSESNSNIKKIEVFQSGSLFISFVFYASITTYSTMLFGKICDLEVLLTGLCVLSLCYWYTNIKKITDKFLLLNPVRIKANHEHL